jgi:hypothetical protein
VFGLLKGRDLCLVYYRAVIYGLLHQSLHLLSSLSLSVCVCECVSVCVCVCVCVCARASTCAHTHVACACTYKNETKK